MSTLRQRRVVLPVVLGLLALTGLTLGAASASAAPAPSPSAGPLVTASPSVTATPTTTPNPSASPSASTTPSPAASPTPSATPTPPLVDGPKGKTVKGPGGSTVTVDVTENLVNQVVHVSWTKFRPSSDTRVLDGTTDPVRVYQCKGIAPKGPQDCYGSSLFGGDGGIPLPDGPTNAQDAVTAPNGQGGVDVEVRTSVQSPSLGCSSKSPCSLVVVPNYGDPAQPDLDFLFAVIGQIDAPFAWARHITVPLAFAPTRESCPLGAADFSTVGSPAAERVITQWQPATCTRTPSVNLDYTAIGEPGARQAFASAQADVALTTLPAGSDLHPTRAAAYAPTSVTAIAVAFRVDDANTGEPITSMKLNARLLAKLITESYGLSGYIAKGAAVGKGNPATVGNAQSIFTDPEFLALNPGPAWPDGGSTPLLMSDNSDLTHTLTEWISADPQARAFLNGTPDQWGMHVNTNFKGISYPSDQFELRDRYDAFTYIFAPVAGLDTVARNLVTNQPPGASPQRYPDGTHPKLPAEPVGSRDLLAVVDTANAAAFRFPVAALEGSTGTFVTPTIASMSAAVSHMKADAAGAYQPAVSATDPDAYPLTVVQSAMVPTTGTTRAKAAKIATFLEYAAGPGQALGVKPGELPIGYLPLPQSLSARTIAVAADVRAQNGTPPPSAPATTSPADAVPAASVPSDSAPSDGAGTAGDVPSSAPAKAKPTKPAAKRTAPAPSAKATPATTIAEPVMLRSAAEDAGPSRLFLPVFLALGGLAAVSGIFLATGWGRRLGGLVPALTSRPRPHRRKSAKP